MNSVLDKECMRQLNIPEKIEKRKIKIAFQLDKSKAYNKIH